MSTRHILVAVAWPYAKALQHLGHFAGAYLPPDIFARYHRIAGNAVLMVSGADAHGTPITVAADEDGVEPSSIVEHFHPLMLDQWEQLGIDFDLFTTTMTDNHREVTWELFRGLHDAGLVVSEVTDQYFDPEKQRFLPDRYVEGTCPVCGYPDARGDQCDNCTSTLDPTDLIDPRSTLSGATPELRQTEHWFIDLPGIADELAEWLEGREDWRPHVINWARGFVRSGLQRRAITRDLTWGVPIPPEYDTLGEGKRIYVWFEAVIGYLSAAREWAAGTDDPEAWRRWWNDDAESYYFVGKDNIPFHAVFWPSYLLGYNRADRDRDLNLPTDVPANQYVTFKGEKASTSRGVGTLVLDYLDTFSADQLRFAVARHLPELNDADITEEDLVKVANDELANDWGNLVNRVLTMTRKHFDESVPEPADLDDVDRALLAEVEARLAAEAAAIEAVELRSAVQEALGLARAANAYLNAREPWRTRKDDPVRTGTTLWVALQAIGAGTVAFAPFTPFSVDVLRGWLGLGPVVEGGWQRPEVVAGTPISEPEVLFPKLEVDPA
ncbi:methionine--tRNA ligase [Salsipaludibacter albus]|uniref:methionine--tRNA ligase n=1 Tax=Salsipaludibacter albus TaxID=2849650 RepID=UPI001EE49AC1|nr:methionine--tRNA ligase [Salsipaludibacter albus]MBY5160899.1 methionine--tRNA ligase [Salsipaludibacter albus]